MARIQNIPIEMKLSNLFLSLDNDTIQVPTILLSWFCKKMYKQLNTVLNKINKSLLKEDLDDQEIIEEKELINPKRKKCFILLNNPKANNMLNSVKISI